MKLPRKLNNKEVPGGGMWNQLLEYVASNTVQQSRSIMVRRTAQGTTLDLAPAHRSRNVKQLFDIHIERPVEDNYYFIEPESPGGLVVASVDGLAVRQGACTLSFLQMPAAVDYNTLGPATAISDDLASLAVTTTRQTLPDDLTDGIWTDNDFPSVVNGYTLMIHIEVLDTEPCRDLLMTVVLA